MFDVDAYRANGFLGPFRVLDADRARSLGTHLVEATATPGPNFRNEQGGRDDLSCRHLDVPAALEVCTLPTVLDAAEAVLGPDLLLFVSRLWVKDPVSTEAKGGHSPTAVPWHQDATYWRLDPQVSCNAWIALSDVTADAAPLTVVPGTHHARRETVSSDSRFGYEVPISAAEQDRVEVFVMSAGECILFDGNLLHGSLPNTAAHRRVALSANFAPASVRVADDWPFPGHESVLVRGAAVEARNNLRTPRRE